MWETKIYHFYVDFQPVSLRIWRQSHDEVAWLYVVALDASLEVPSQSREHFRHHGRNELCFRHAKHGFHA